MRRLDAPPDPPASALVSSQAAHCSSKRARKLRVGARWVCSQAISCQPSALPAHQPAPRECARNPTPKLCACACQGRPDESVPRHRGRGPPLCAAMDPGTGERSPGAVPPSIPRGCPSHESAVLAALPAPRVPCSPNPFTDPSLSLSSFRKLASRHTPPSPSQPEPGRMGRGDRALPSSF